MRSARRKAEGGRRSATIPLAAILLAVTVAAVPGQRADFPRFDANRLLQHIRVLSSDQFAGRLPGTPGEQLTISYIADQFTKAGLKPGSADGTFLQKVPLVGMTPSASMAMTFRRGGRATHLKYMDDFVAWTRRQQPRVSLANSPLVFVGYGVQAPEFRWDDYKGVDVKGKTLVVLVNDPPVPDPRNPARLDPNVFGGDAMTYYGRWTYKYDVAAEKGAAGVLLVHETGPAGYPWSVVRSFGGERFDLVAPNRNMDKAIVEGWITLEQARVVFAQGRQNFDTLKQRAATRDFRPVPLDVTASVAFDNTIRQVESHNVIGRLEGRDPALKGECVVFTAHWDHFGTTPAGIFHGADDNASGVAGLIEIARAFARLPASGRAGGAAARPKRTLLFVSVTGEEQGLLGSRYYAEHPVVPLSKTLADINLDMLNVHGRTRDLTIVGLGKSDLDDYVKRAAAEQGRSVHGDLEPAKGYFYRSDHFEMAKLGVPGLYVHWVRNEFEGKPADFGKNVADHYTERDYHKPTDVITADWNMSGALQDLQLMWRVGCDVANASKYPAWKPGAEFRR